MRKLFRKIWPLYSDKTPKNVSFGWIAGCVLVCICFAFVIREATSALFGIESGVLPLISNMVVMFVWGSHLGRLNIDLLRGKSLLKIASLIGVTQVLVILAIMLAVIVARLEKESLSALGPKDILVVVASVVGLFSFAAALAAFALSQARRMLEKNR